MSATLTNIQARFDRVERESIARLEALERRVFVRPRLQTATAYH